jgi:hypothetical protein
MIVWVVFAVGERMTRGRDPTQPLTAGAMSIFAPTVTKVETVFDCIGAYTDQAQAFAAAGRHHQAHPGERARIKVATVDAPAEAAEPQPAACTECGVPSSTGMCRPCQVRQWERSRDNDPELLEDIRAAEEAKALEAAR